MSEATPGLARERVAEAIGSLWWLPLVRGLLLICVGAYALFRPEMTAAALAQVIGVFLVLDGILGLIAGISGAVPSRGWTILRGVIAILVGIFVFANPTIVAGVTAQILLYVVGFSFILTGLLEVFAAIRDRKEIEGEGWIILGGILAILFGILLLAAPLTFGRILLQILGAYAIIYGICLIVMAFRIRGVGKRLAA